ncbi:ATP-binding protein [Pedobacter hartonius]|uniref:AAA domain-containing protein n=1 Tax=Pedobacter hartonius TaxID=425514 RepID=A0A1H4HIX1_9SPHI|nr:ATP-binding protein [Pedobacter hartonius]SEB21546.1 AAA domain-containing protein [Pedobacter hartonius]
MITNNLFVNRLVVISLNGSIAYNEAFHKGVNIIRGDNSSGKSTISNFIFYILGGEFTDFVPEAKKCSEVFAETEMSGATITLRRQIELDENRKVKTRTSIYFFWGNYEESRNPPTDKHWQKFGYNSYPETKSFSNVIFDNLNIPTVKGDSNITIHQLLRLMYIDQESPTGSLFVYEQFDSQITRETTADLLLGVYDDDLYQNKKGLIDITKEIDELKSEIKATKGFFSNALLLNPSHIEVKIENTEKKISEIEQQIITLKAADRVRTIKADKFRYQQLSSEISKQRGVVTKLKDDYINVQHEILDNDFFIGSLNEKLKALKNSSVTREFLNNFQLEYCPECLSEIKPHVKADGQESCKLCKETIDSTYGLTQVKRMQQEINFQIIESNSIQKLLKDELEAMVPQIKKETGVLQDLQKQFDSEIEDVNTSRQEQIENLATEKGLAEGEIMQFRTMLENAQFYASLLERRDQLVRQRDQIDAFIKQIENQQNTLKFRVENQIKKEALYFLTNDFHRQDEFKNANDFHIDFSNNIAFLSSKYAKYSASSNFYLKISARFALFLASLSIPEMRYPRFILADNMEDKGIEEKRAQNFQKILIERLKDFDPTTYQVIYTTSYITDELNKSDLVVGKFHTIGNRTLQNL